MHLDYTTSSSTAPDPAIAQRFLTLLDESDDHFTFEVIEEPKPNDRKPKIQRYHGTLQQYQEALLRANMNGYGVFVAVNKTNCRGRSKSDIVQVRALFVDLDGSPVGPVYDAPLEPHLIIESSPERYHAYWLIEDLPLEHFEAAQKFLGQKFNGDPCVHDLPRLMRLPGFIHRKKVPYRSRIIETTSTLPYSREKFQAAFVWNPENTTVHPTPCTRTDSTVLDRLREQGLLKREGEPETGRWCINCPWSHEHTDGSMEAFFYTKPSKAYPHGGFKCFHAHCKHRDSRALRFYLGLTPLEGVEPLPLFREVPPPTPYPVEALGPILGLAANELHETIKSPMAVIAQSLLGAASLVTQRHANVETADGRSIALSLFLITVAESGERKSAVDDVVLSAVFKWQSMLCGTYREEKAKYEDELNTWTETKKKARASNNPTLNSELGTEPEPPTMPIIVVEEPTYEGLVKYLEHGQPSVGLFSDEGGRFLGGNAMSRENMLKTLSGLSSLWDAKKDKPITRIRSGDKSLALYSRRCALHLMIQESVYGRLSENSICESQGFLPRCLVSFPESMAGSRKYIEQNPRELPGVQAFQEHCNTLLDQPFSSKPHPAPKNQLDVPSIRLSPEAHNRYVEHHNNWERKLGKEGEYHNIRRFGSKAPEHLLRVAGVLAIFEDPSATIISVDHVDRAATIVNYYLAERYRLDSYYCVEPTLLTAQKVLDWAQGKEKPGVTLRDLYQYGPPEVRSKNKATAILVKLEEHGRAFPVPPCDLGKKGTGKAWRFVWHEN